MELTAPATRRRVAAIAARAMLDPKLTQGALAQRAADPVHARRRRSDDQERGVTVDRLEAGKALLASIDAQRADPATRSRAVADAVEQANERSDVEERFFAELDDLRTTDPDAFSRVSSPMKVAYAEWKRTTG